MNVKSVKAAIAKTECSKYVCAGLYCSEPMMSKDKNGNVIDNYFVYSRNIEKSEVYSPTVMFGIYTDRGETAYVDEEAMNKFDADSYSEHFDDIEVLQGAMKKYIEVYPKVREMFMLNNKNDKNEISIYLECLSIISGKTVFSFYEKLFPSFFDWARI